MKLRTPLLTLTACVISLIATCQLNGIISFFTPLISNNFHIVQPEKAYRSGQMSSSALAHYIKKYNIKTVINLRGIEQEKTWWQDEHTLMHKLGLHYVNIPLLAYRFPSQEQLKQLLTTFSTKPKPILLHCHHGRDRTGLAAALWVYEVMKQDKHKALQQLNYNPYGHLSLIYPAMKAFIQVWTDLREKYSDITQALEMYNPKEYGYETS